MAGKKIVPIVPLFKKGDKQSIKNYYPVPLFPIPLQSLLKNSLDLGLVTSA